MERRELFKNKYRIKSVRLTNYDYSGDDAYFITICTKDRIPWFGEIRNGVMGLSEIGCIVWRTWNEIPKHFPFIALDAFIVMPDHIHGILEINKQMDPDYHPDFRRDAIHRVSDSHYPNTKYAMKSVVRGDAMKSVVRGDAMKSVVRGDAMNRVSTVKNNPMLNPYSLSAVVRAFKSRLSRRIRATHPTFQWQSRFYDRIIRDDLEMDRIRGYIECNPTAHK